jgi:hypothetical protein
VACRLLITMEILVEAAGVELITMLTARQVIDSRKCHHGEKGPIAGSIVRLLYENAFRS